MDALQDQLPVAPWMEPRLARLPGVVPLEDGDWLRVDEAYAGQMAVRRGLIEDGADVHALQAEAVPAAVELLEAVLEVLPGLGFAVSGAEVRCPDGMTVAVDRDQPLITLGRICQNDFVLMEKHGAEHVLTGAILCFPASWSLAEKFGRPLVEIHEPVDPYDDGIAARVQRLFDGVKPGRGLWRMNSLLYDDAELFQPRRMDARRKLPGVLAPFVRCERQTIVRLPESQAVVFGIHTYVVRRESLTADQQAGLEAAKIGHAAD